MDIKWTIKSIQAKKNYYMNEFYTNAGPNLMKNGKISICRLNVTQTFLYVHKGKDG